MIFPEGAEDKLISAVRQIAAEEIMPRFRTLSASDIATKSRMDDLVTVADKEARLRRGFFQPSPLLAKKLCQKTPASAMRLMRPPA